MSLIVFVFIADSMVYLTWNMQALGPAALSVELCVTGQDGWSCFLVLSSKWSCTESLARGLEAF